MTPTQPPAPVWLQSIEPTALWSGYDDQAIQLDSAAAWDYFRQVQPQAGSRIFVYVARSGNYGWINAASVGPSGPPPAGWPGSSTPPAKSTASAWLAAFVDAPFYPTADSQLVLGLAPAWTPFKQMEPQVGTRIHVQDPYAGDDVYIDAANVGPVGPPQGLGPSSRWWGVVLSDGANLRPGPSTKSGLVGQVSSQNPVVVQAWVAGEEVIKDNIAWAKLSDGGYLYSSVVRPVPLPSAPTPPAGAAGWTGKWVDLNLTQQTVVAYEGANPVRIARTSTGRPGWETDAGIFSVQRRVANETMTSTSLIGMDAQRADYKVDNVRWTQYFTADGKALHENYWKPRDEFGIPSSHGCAGLLAEDAKFFWDWAAVGTPVYSHY